MKKALCILLAIGMLLLLAACSGGSGKTTQQPTGDSQTDTSELPTVDDMVEPETDAPEDAEVIFAGSIPSGFFDAFDDAWTDDGDIWPTADMWASIGLPALDYKDSGVSPTVWNFSDSLSVTGWADEDTKLSDLEGLIQQLRDAGITVEADTSAFANENEHVGYYTCNGVLLKIRLSTGVAEIDIYVSEGQP